MIIAILRHVRPGGLLATLLLMNSIAAVASSAWEPLAPLPLSNGGCICGDVAGTLVVAGGTHWRGDTKVWFDQVWAYDPVRNTWRETARLSAPLAYAAAGTDRSALWFAGGSSGTTTHRSLWKIDSGLTPKLVAPLDRGFVYTTGALIGSTLYAIGGTDDQAAVERTGNTFLAIDVKTGTITRLADYPEVGLTTGTATVIGEHLYVFGGARWDLARKAAVNHATAHVYSVAKKAWTPLPSLPHPGRGFSAVALDTRHIVVAGGYRDDEVEFVSEVYIYDIEKRTYTPTTPLPYAGMVGLVKSGDWLYCLGGEDRKKHRSDAVFRIRWRELLASRH